jgi:hypothetical protein
MYETRHNQWELASYYCCDCSSKYCCTVDEAIALVHDCLLYVNNQLLHHLLRISERVLRETNLAMPQRRNRGGPFFGKKLLQYVVVLGNLPKYCPNRKIIA